GLLGCWGGLATRWGCHGCYGASQGCHGCVGMNANNYGGAVWGANYTYTHSYPGMPPTNVPTPIPPTAPKPMPASKPVDDGKGAHLILKMPAHAKLYIDGQLMKDGIGTRQFFTPPLQPGQAYFYDVKVEVMKDGKPVIKEKPIVVKAGDVIRESFTDLGNPTGVASAGK